MDRNRDETTPEHLAYWRGRVDNELKDISRRLSAMDTSLSEMRKSLEQHSKLISRMVGVGIFLAISVPLLWNTFIGPLLVKKP